jgi:hypothetical protein
MSTARHHAEWLSLVEASGPFLSMEVLLGAFPQGLDAHESDHFRLLKQAYEEWLENSQESGIHRAWIHWVLRETLEFPDEVLLTGQAIPQGLQVTVAEHQETLHPDWIVANPPQSPLDKANPPQSPLDKANPPQSPLDKGGQRGVKPRLLVQVYSPEQGLEKPFKSGRWKASPATRMMELLHGTQVRLGLVTNGEHWMLVRAPRGETTSYISWYGNLWVEEKITLRAFRCLLGVRRFFGVTDEETIEALFEKSKNAQHEVTDQLGYQVRKAVEVLVQKLDRIDQDRNRTLLQNISDRELYEAALFVMMRLVFLFSAEEKGLIPHPESQLYENYYAVSTLREKLREEADKYGEEILERRHDAWCRLLATFRAVYGGVACDLLAIPAYGGDLFNPNKFAFLEGREEDSHQNLERKPISVDNRTVLHLLEALQILQVKVPGGGSEPRRLSFRALDVEQIGHVYEGLLDHTAVRASTPVLGLIGTKDKEPEVSLDALEMQLAKGEDALVKYLKEATGRSEAALRKIITPPNLPFLRGGTTSNSPRVKEGLRGVNLEPHEEGRFLVACHNDSQLWERIKHFAQLIRRDTFDYPLIIPQGSIYVTQGSDRRETGTHYTPKSLTEEIVRYTLEPLVYEGVAQGKPKEEWQLKSATELLNLEICDMAMGSGAFLVQVCRYLGERLVEAWERAENPPMSPLAKGGFRGVNRDNKKWIVVTPEGKLSQSRPEECLIPEDATERLIVAKRIVAERCIYGVDKNPLAVEMAKLSLWLETMQRDKPFTFLDHALKCGDSLVGVSLKQLHCWDLDTSLGVRQLGIGIDLMQREVDEAIAYRLQIEAKPVITQQDQKEKANLLKLANSRINDLRTRCDLLIQSYLVEGSKANKEALRESLLLAAQGKKDVTETEKVILPDLEKLRPFHWELEFPEVFLTPLNPPWEHVNFVRTDELVKNGNINENKGRNTS